MTNDYKEKVELYHTLVNLRTKYRKQLNNYANSNYGSVLKELRQEIGEYLANGLLGGKE